MGTHVHNKTTRVNNFACAHFDLYTLYTKWMTKDGDF